MNMQHHLHELHSVDYLPASSAVRWHGFSVHTVFPALRGTAGAAAVWVKPRHTITTQARLSQQDYWQAFDDYYEDMDKYKRKLWASGIKPLTYSQQEGRYVNWWVEGPLMMDKELCKTSAIFSFLHNLHPDDFRALLDGTLESELTRITASSNDQCWQRYHETSSLLGEYSHIIPVSRGGCNNRLNYFLMPLAINNYFGNSRTAEKIAYIGVNAALGAGCCSGYKVGFDCD